MEQNRKSTEVSGNLKLACKRFGEFLVELLYLRWRCIYALYKRLLNLQHKVYVIRNFWKKKKIGRTDVTNFVSENLRTETKTSWEHVKVDTAHLFGPEAWVSHRRMSPKKVGNFRFTLSEYWKVSKGALLVFLEVSSASGNFWHCLLVRCKNYGKP